MKKLALLIFFLPSLVFGQNLSFTADTLKGCIPLQVQFHSSVSGNFLWLFGDGNSSTLPNPVHLYQTEGNFSVSLISYNQSSPDTLVKSAYITTKSKPTASYSISNPILCKGSEPTNFVNNGDSSLNYTWDFGDGHMVQAYSVRHSYQTPGTYPTTLFASDSMGCSNSWSFPAAVEIKEIPDVDFTVDTNLACSSNKLFSFSSLSDSSYAHRWNFGNLDSSSQTNPTIGFQQSGFLSVALEVTAQNGCTAKRVKEDFIGISQYKNALISISDSIVCSGKSIRFKADSNWSSAQWDFGNGNQSSNFIGINSYSISNSYQPSVILEDSVGCAFTFLLDSVKVLQSPIASILRDSITDCAPLHLAVNNTSFYANSYNWEIGEKKSSTASPSFQFDSSGVFDLQLIASNLQCSDTLKIQNWLKLGGGNTQITVSDSSGCAPHAVSLNLVNSEYENVRWNLGNGDTLNGSQASYVYKDDGKYRPFAIATIGQCTDTIFYKDSIEVLAAPFNFHTPDTIILCSYGSVDFIGSAIGGNFWNWDFGDGDTSSLANPSHDFDSAGVFAVKLRTENTNGCYYDLDPYNVIKVKNVTAAFKDTVSNCPFYQVDFHSLDDQIQKWEWDFGDGYGDTIPDPSHFYGSIGHFNIQLKVWDEDGCFAKKTKLNQVSIYKCLGNGQIDGGSSGVTSGGGIGSFTEDADSIVACAPFNLEVELPFDTIVNQWWDFGDGNSSRDSSVSHWYLNEGSYTLTLIVEYVDGTFDTIQNHNYIQLGKPLADFSFDITNECDSSTVSLKNKSSEASSFIWNLGHLGTSSAYEADVVFKNESNQLIQLTAFDDKGCSSVANKNIATGTPNPFFDFIEQKCLGDSIIISSNASSFFRYEWEVGNFPLQAGEVYRGLAIDTGEFTIRLHAFDQSGCKQIYTSTKTLKVFDPQANFVINDSAIACDEYRLDVSNLSTGANQYLWKFNNGDSSLLKTPSTIFTDSGSIHVELRASKGSCESSFQIQNAITVNKAFADFTISQNKNCFPITTSFSDLSANAVAWVWKFGDGDSSLLQNPSHTFNQKPINAVQLSIVDVNGCQTTTTKDILDYHQAKPAANQWQGCIPLEIEFFDSTANVNSYFWDFGDGHTSTQAMPTHTYSAAGVYDLTLITASALGCSDTTFISAAIHAGEVSANFEAYTARSGCAPHLVAFNNQSVGGTEFIWKFSNMVNTDPEPLAVFHNFGRHSVQLIANNGFGCSDTIQKENYINVNTPKIDFSISDTAHCGPTEIEFEDLSERVVERNWFFNDGSKRSDQKFRRAYNSTGNYQITLMVTDTAGCNESKSQTINIKEQPLASFALSSVLACAPQNIQFINQSSQLDNANFDWLLGSNTVRNTFDTTILFNSSAILDVGLIANNANGCSDTTLKSDHLKVFETKTAEKIEMHSVGRNDRNDWILYWSKSNDLEFNYYQIYRKTLDNNFVEYVKIYDPNTTTLSIFNQPNWSSKQCFKIQAVNHCVTQLSPDSLLEYCSIDLTTTTDSSGIILNWTDYPNIGFQNYRLERSRVNSAWTTLANLSDTTSTYLDTDILCPEKYKYRIRPMNEFPIETFSNTSEVLPISKVLKSENVRVQRATILENNHVLLEWKLAENLDPTIEEGIAIQKRDSRGHYAYIDQLSAGSRSFIDKNQQVDKTAMHYKIELSHTCSTSLNPASRASSIWLSVKTDGSIDHLRWTPAEGIDGEVDKYIIQKKNEFGEWKTIEEVPANTLEFKH